ncbi:hypothetical protein NE236_34425 [Actinoallomurus purpureus]|uniref:hypothetical protein n=1 Tax=Actinoallomurus purpureus TaxID=478114 RepID=UPI002092FC50|nr:hypothetical protein [Actinoallomurus purpureus]MCO6010077.1 hypothetical protein [Actinoallomurus purpureus]
MNDSRPDGYLDVLNDLTCEITAALLAEDRLARTVADALADTGEFVRVVRVRCEDRLARFGVGWLKRLFAADGVELEVLHAGGSCGRGDLWISRPWWRCLRGGCTGCGRARRAGGCRPRVGSARRVVSHE